MARHGDKTVEDSPEEWLDNFSTFSIYQILPQLIKLWGLNIKTEKILKKVRPMTTPLFLLRAVERGLSVFDLDLLTIGLITDMDTEKTNDEWKDKQVVTQEDFDKL
ncbi:hypothetical protein [Facklamia sp. P9177]|uniref:hypothetical protein n=1 Tax=Facklamia sp. P9177 TaxID=3421945 RepID=UPI003D18142B